MCPEGGRIYSPVQSPVLLTIQIQTNWSSVPDSNRVHQSGRLGCLPGQTLRKWSPLQVSNLPPHAPKASALPTELNGEKLEHEAGVEPARISRQLCRLLPSATWLLVRKLVRPERFELSTPWIEARCSIQMSYGRQTKWWRLTASNRRPSACKADALPTELNPRKQVLVPQVGLEPTRPKALTSEASASTDSATGAMPLGVPSRVRTCTSCDNRV